MHFSEIFSTKERIKILGYLLEHPSKKINMNKLARKLKLSPGQIHKYITILRKEKIVIKDCINESSYTHSLRLLWNLKRIQKSSLEKILQRSFSKLKGYGIFGSWANGTNTEEADLDIWLKMDKEPDDLQIANARREIQKKIGVAVDLVVATPIKLKHFKDKSETFYFSLYHGKVLWGENL
jgi:predicted nucleotidyltransferase